MSTTTDRASTKKQSLFVLDDGRNLMFTFILVSSLFLLWGVCNGMIDVMDKHFQNELHLSKSQSAWVQFAHYLGYFLMALPAGWLASRLGYKGGIIAGLLMVSLGGFWFLPATKINAMAQAGQVSANTAFVGYLAGVCAIAAGLTFLETVANPYTTVLGPQRYAATRINLAQSCNGVGWICGPIIGSWFFYSTDAAGQSTGSQTLYIPYVTVACVVLGLAVVFYFARVPDIRAEDDYQVDGEDPVDDRLPEPARVVKRGQVYLLLLLNAAVLIGVVGMILWLILSAFNVGDQLVGVASQIPHPADMTITAHNSAFLTICGGGVLLTALVALPFIPLARRISHHSMWSHPHFSAAVLTQFLYVAAQAGIFSFLINYMTEEMPALPNAWHTEAMQDWLGIKTKFTKDDIQDLPALAVKLNQKRDAVSEFLSMRLSDDTRRVLAEYEGPARDAEALRLALVQDFNGVVSPDPKKVKASEFLYNPQRFRDIRLSEESERLLGEKKQAEAEIRAGKLLTEDRTLAADKKLLEERRLQTIQRREAEISARLNRHLLVDAYPKELVYRDGILGISDSLGSLFVTLGFVCFLVGRFTGAALLKKYSAHKILGLYGVLNVAACLLVFLKLGWLSVACVFLSYFFMSIMFPTIFALGIFGLGARAKEASAFIVMAIMGGAVLPKLMGRVADQYDMSRGFIVPLACFVCVALYGFIWPKLSNADSLHSLGTSKGH